MTSVSYRQVQSLPAIWPIAAAQFGDGIALFEPHEEPAIQITYQQLWAQIQQFAAGLQFLGVVPESKVAFFADNSPRWFIADQGIMTAGAVDVVRSALAERQELLYIIKDSDSTSLVVENQKTLTKLLPDLEDLPIKLIVLLSDEEPPSLGYVKVINFAQLMVLGSKHPLKPVSQTPDTLATLIYTSGTTGQPKGVMLSHGNLLHQVLNLDTIIQPEPQDVVLSLLPSWHSYERAAEYFLISRGCTQIYSSIRSFKKDLVQYKPHFMVGVPRLWESIYEGIQKQFRDQPASKQKVVQFFLKLSEKYIHSRRIAQKLSLNHLQASQAERTLAALQAAILGPFHKLGDKLVYSQVRAGLGGKLKVLVSGGGSLAMHLEDFYEIIGINILVGYGLTETSPVTNARVLTHNLRGSAGRPIPETEIRIVDPETKQTLPSGRTGLVLIRGPQVMQGYYHKPEATAKAIDPQGWFDSGDLGWVTPQKDLVLTGRAKDTIVLTNGENIEPQPIEDACLRSPYIDQIMLVGQDQRSLGALIVPNLEALQKWLTTQQPNLQLFSGEEVNYEVLKQSAITDLFRQELNREVKNRPGYRQDDRIGPFEFILEPFTIDNGMMTQTLKIKRPVVTQHYHDLIESMFKK